MTTVKETNWTNLFQYSQKKLRSFISVIPISLEIRPYYFLEENSQILEKFFQQCSDMIFKLCVKFPLDGGLMNLNFNHINFPILRVFIFEFEDQKNDYEYKSKASFFRSNTNGLTFLQEILQSSKNLKQFVLKHESYSDENIGFLSLPPTVQDLALRCPLSDYDLTLITNNELPNLKKIDLEIDQQNQVHTMYKILEIFQQQLTSLVYNVMSRGWHTNIRIKFPLMEKLKTLKLSGSEYDLVTELRQVWPKLVPNLSQLIIENLMVSEFFDLLEGLTFENVDKLKLSLTNWNHETYSPDAPILRGIVPAFPNIQKLTLKFSFSNISTLKYLFKSFAHLKKLNLIFDNDKENSTPRYEIISIFLGIPLELAEALANKTKENVNIATDNPESIMNLKGK